MGLRDRILEKAGNLFLQYGIKNSSMDEIASSMGISKWTIYENFRDKEDLLISFLKRGRDERNVRIFDYQQESSNVIEVFLKIVEAQQNIPIPNVKFFEDIHNYFPLAEIFIKKDIAVNNAFLCDFLRKGIKQGYIRGNLNVEVTAFLVEDSTYTYIRATSLEQPPFHTRSCFSP